MEKYTRMIDGVEVPMTADEITERQAEEAREAAIQQNIPLPVKLNMLLQEAAADIADSIEAGVFIPPPGLFIQVAAISAGLKELVTLVPLNLYGQEAKAAIISLGILPEPLEAVRLNILSEIEKEIK